MAGRVVGRRGSQFVTFGSVGRPRARSPMTLRLDLVRAAVDRVGARCRGTSRVQAVVVGSPSHASPSAARARRSRARRGRGGTTPRTACGSTSPRSTVPCSSAGSLRSAWYRMTRNAIHASASRWRNTGSAAQPVRRASAVIVAQLVLERELLAERRRAALERERAHRDPPPAVDLADDVVGARARARRRRPR